MFAIRADIRPWATNGITSHVQIKNICSTSLQQIKLIDYTHYVLGSNHGTMGWRSDVGRGPTEGHDKNHRIRQSMTVGSLRLTPWAEAGDLQMTLAHRL